MNAYLGRTSPMILAISLQSPLASPSIPAPFPAQLMSWHSYGNPPHMASSDDTSFQALNAAAHSGLSDRSVVTSSQTGKTGRTPSSCLCSKTLRGYSSISTAQTGVCPSRMSARIPPPAPANRCKVYKTSSSPRLSFCILIVVRGILPRVLCLREALQVFYGIVSLVAVHVVYVVSSRNLAFVPLPNIAM